MPVADGIVRVSRVRQPPLLVLPQILPPPSLLRITNGLTPELRVLSAITIEQTLWRRGTQKRLVPSIATILERYRGLTSTEFKIVRLDLSEHGLAKPLKARPLTHPILGHAPPLDPNAKSRGNLAAKSYSRYTRVETPDASYRYSVSANGNVESPVDRTRSPPNCN